MSIRKWLCWARMYSTARIMYHGSEPPVRSHSCVPLAFIAGVTLQTVRMISATNMAEVNVIPYQCADHHRRAGPGERRGEVSPSLPMTPRMMATEFTQKKMKNQTNRPLLPSKYECQLAEPVRMRPFSCNPERENSSQLASTIVARVFQRSEMKNIASSERTPVNRAHQMLMWSPASRAPSSDEKKEPSTAMWASIQSANPA